MTYCSYCPYLALLFSCSLPSYLTYCSYHKPSSAPLRAQCCMNGQPKPSEDLQLLTLSEPCTQPFITLTTLVHNRIQPYIPASVWRGHMICCRRSSLAERGALRMAAAVTIQVSPCFLYHPQHFTCQMQLLCGSTLGSIEDMLRRCSQVDSEFFHASGTPTQHRFQQPDQRQR